MAIHVEITAPVANSVPLRIAADPRMPDLRCAARLAEYSGGQVTFNWQLDIRWQGTGTQSFGQFLGQTTANNSEESVWQPNFGDQFFGGTVRLVVKARTAAGTTYNADASPVRILGTQPADNEILAAIGTSPWYARRIGRHEAGLRQFSAAGEPQLNQGGDGGAGIFQITGSNQTPQHIWNWRGNVAKGLQMMSANASAATTFWTRQVDQFNEWNAAHPTATVDPPGDVTYGAVTFSFNPTAGQRSFADAIAIKMFNSATRHFLVWYNVGEYATHPEWRFNLLNGQGFNYVERVCSAAD